MGTACDEDLSVIQFDLNHDVHEEHDFFHLFFVIFVFFVVKKEFFQQIRGNCSSMRSVSIRLPPTAVSTNTFPGY